MKLKVGDVFRFDFDKLTSGIGQIVDIPDEETIVVVIYEGRFQTLEDISLSMIVSGDILLFSTTFDAKLHNKDWKIIGNLTENLSNIKHPYYKLGTYPDVKVINYEGEHIRSALSNEIEQLNYRNYVAPVRLETAYRAFHHKGEWIDDYNKLLYKYVIDSIKLIESN